MGVNCKSMPSIWKKDCSFPPKQHGEFQLTLLVERNECLGDGLSDGVDLGDVSTAVDADADIDTSELFLLEEYLETVCEKIIGNIQCISLEEITRSVMNSNNFMVLQSISG